ncbi:MAG: hypothetical protein GY867_10145 [bacterium]|nr:hypothetical protein [bacterium]
MSPVLVGSLGVAVLLLAFVLNLTRKLSEQSSVYLLLNFVGAGLAAWYAWHDRIIPFIVLEAVWGGTALVRLLLGQRKNPRPSTGA